MSVLTDAQIVEHMKEGNIVISPFVPKNLNTTSYDVTLGAWYYREQRTAHPKESLYPRYYNMYDKNHVNNVWGRPHHALRFGDIHTDTKKRLGDGINDDDYIIWIAPGETILAHTNERIGGQNCVTTEMKARSTIGRSFIGVCKCAGWGDIGYTNIWTFEITNFSQQHTIPLVVNRRIAQIVFYETDECDRNYSNEGKYQDSKRSEWKPQDMLPKAYLDYEILKK